MTKRVAENDFPALYLAADGASVAAQTSYTRFIRADLFMVVLGALFSSFSAATHEGRSWFAITGAVLFGFGFVITLALKFTRHEKTWYGARAVAESAKSLAWKYMVGSDPMGLLVADADKVFTDALRDLLSEKQHLAFDFDAQANQRPQITDKMRAVRALSHAERKQLFLTHRLGNQKEWYSTKAGFNQTKEKKYFGMALFAQFCAFLMALWLVKEPEAHNLTGFFSSLAVGIFSWMQIKKFQELAQSYALTAQELGMIEAGAPAVVDDVNLGVFVSNTENAISREHTMWIARRGQ